MVKFVRLFKPVLVLYRYWSDPFKSTPLVPNVGVLAAEKFLPFLISFALDVNGRTISRYVLSGPNVVPFALQWSTAEDELELIPSEELLPSELELFSLTLVVPSELELEEELEEVIPNEELELIPRLLELEGSAT